jgi:hypothetical protein
LQRETKAFFIIGVKKILKLGICFKKINGYCYKNDQSMSSKQKYKLSLVAFKNQLFLYPNYKKYNSRIGCKKQNLKNSELWAQQILKKKIPLLASSKV